MEQQQQKQGGRGIRAIRRLAPLRGDARQLRVGARAKAAAAASASATATAAAPPSAAAGAAAAAAQEAAGFEFVVRAKRRVWGGGSGAAGRQQQQQQQQQRLWQFDKLGLADAGFGAPGAAGGAYGHREGSWGQAVLSLPLGGADVALRLPPGLSVAATRAGGLDVRLQLLGLQADWPARGGGSNAGGDGVGRPQARLLAARSPALGFATRAGALLLAHALFPDNTHGLLNWLAAPVAVADGVALAASLVPPQVRRAAADTLQRRGERRRRQQQQRDAAMGGGSSSSRGARGIGLLDGAAAVGGGALHALRCLSGPAAALASAAWLWALLHPGSQVVASCAVALLAVSADYNHLQREVRRGRVGDSRAVEAAWHAAHKAAARRTAHYLRELPATAAPPLQPLVRAAQRCRIAAGVAVGGQALCGFVAGGGGGGGGWGGGSRLDAPRLVVAASAALTAARGPEQHEAAGLSRAQLLELFTGEPAEAGGSSGSSSKCARSSSSGGAIDDAIGVGTAGSSRKGASSPGPATPRSLAAPATPPLLTPRHAGALSGAAASSDDEAPDAAALLSPDVVALVRPPSRRGAAAAAKPAALPKAAAPAAAAAAALERACSSSTDDYVGRQQLRDHQQQQQPHLPAPSNICTHGSGSSTTGSDGGSSSSCSSSSGSSGSSRVGALLSPPPCDDALAFLDALPLYGQEDHMAATASAAAAATAAHDAAAAGSDAGQQQLAADAAAASAVAAAHAGAGHRSGPIYAARLCVRAAYLLVAFG